MTFSTCTSVFTPVLSNSYGQPYIKRGQRGSGFFLCTESGSAIRGEEEARDDSQWVRLMARTIMKWWMNRHPGNSASERSFVTPFEETERGDSFAIRIDSKFIRERKFCNRDVFLYFPHTAEIQSEKAGNGKKFKKTFALSCRRNIREQSLRTEIEIKLFVHVFNDNRCNNVILLHSLRFPNIWTSRSLSVQPIERKIWGIVIWRLRKRFWWFII